jgi:protein gp37
MNDDGTPGKTWNPTDGCKVCSPGCANCYAMRFAGRFAKPGERYHGLVTIGKNKRAIWTGKGRLDAGKLARPLHWKKPRRIFVNSMSDLFYEEFTNEEIAAVYGVMAACPQHTFQILTKRARRRREWFGWLDSEARRVAVSDPDSPWWRAFVCIVAASKALGRVTSVEVNRDGSLNTRGKHDVLSGAGGATWPLANAWEGVSVEDQDAADERILELLRTPAAVRFLSCEPLLGPLDLTLRGSRIADWDEDWKYDTLRGAEWSNGSSAKLDWVIAGCESGPKARPCAPDDLRSLRDQCHAAEVPFFLKQAQGVRKGCVAPSSAPPEIIKAVSPTDRTRFTDIITAGPGSKHKAGGIIGLPYLDGVQHAAFPITKEMTP